MYTSAVQLQYIEYKIHTHVAKAKFLMTCCHDQRVKLLPGVNVYLYHRILDSGKIYSTIIGASLSEPHIDE